MAAKSPIEHIVVLTMENRSFDHMLGFLPRTGNLSNLDGLIGNESNHLEPSDPTSLKITVKKGAIYEFFGDKLAHGCNGPEHGFPEAVEQLTGRPWDGSNFGAITNDGFVKSFANVINPLDAPHLQLVMEAFTPDQLPALSTLAQEFVVCDHWFSSIPGPTMPNRLFMHAATSYGYDYNKWRGPFPFDSIYNRLDNAGKSWKVYSSNLEVAKNFERLRQCNHAIHFPRSDTFYTDASNDNLPNYSFIAPNFIDASNYGAVNSQHAPTDVAHGEKLIADVYNAIRSNDALWKKTLLVVIYDEHGGFYDHVAPPGGVPSPDGLKGSLGFDFTQLGVRVPAVLVSPWLPKMVDQTVYEHSSIAATLNRFWGLGKYLTKRDEAAGSFEKLLSGGAFRSDTPDRLTYPERADASTSHHGSRPIDDIQKDIALAAFDHEPDEKKRSLMKQLVDAGATQREVAAMLYEVVEKHTQERSH